MTSNEYAEWLEEYACEHDVDLRTIKTGNGKSSRETENRQKYISLWDVYPFADFITYPSLYEGFGNAFLEAIYFKKPMLVNRYTTFVRDIEPQGFDLAVMDGFLSKRTIQAVPEILCSMDVAEPPQWLLTVLPSLLMAVVSLPKVLDPLGTTQPLSCEDLDNS